jgi:GR25 family glycosyltransferase involved in LPS biosynthesis
MVIIDKIYLINLKKRTDRLESCKKLFNSLGGIFNNFEIVEAVLGNELSDDEIYKLLSSNSLLSLKHKYHLHYDIRNKNGIGCYLSHYNIWKDIVKNNYKNVLIFEDDITSPNTFDTIKKYIDSIPTDYGIGFMSYWNYNEPIVKLIPENDFWLKSSSYTFYQTDAYMLSNVGAKILLEKALPISNQVDAFINVLASANKNFKRYFSKEKLFFQNKSEYGSDIQQTCKVCNMNQAVDFSSSHEDFINKLKNLYNVEGFSNITDYEMFDNQLPINFFPTEVTQSIKNILNTLNPNGSSINTIKPSVTAVQPSVTTVQPSVTAVQPSVTAVQPSVTAVQPSVTTVQPSVTTVQPSVTTVQPSVTAVQPSVTTVQPSVTAVQPSVTAVQPSCVTQPASCPKYFNFLNKQDSILLASSILLLFVFCMIIIYNNSKNNVKNN